MVRRRRRGGWNRAGIDQGTVDFEFAVVVIGERSIRVGCAEIAAGFLCVFFTRAGVEEDAGVLGFGVDFDDGIRR